MACRAVDGMSGISRLAWADALAAAKARGTEGEEIFQLFSAFEQGWMLGARKNG